MAEQWRDWDWPYCDCHSLPRDDCFLCRSLRFHSMVVQENSSGSVYSTWDYLRLFWQHCAPTKGFQNRNGKLLLLGLASFEKALSRRSRCLFAIDWGLLRCCHRFAWSSRRWVVMWRYLQPTLRCGLLTHVPCRSCRRNVPLCQPVLVSFRTTAATTERNVGGWYK